MAGASVVVIISLIPSISGHCLFTSAAGDRSETVNDGKWTRALGWRPEPDRKSGYQFSGQWDIPIFATTAVPWAEPICTNTQCCQKKNCWSSGYYTNPGRSYNPSGCGITLHHLVQYWEVGGGKAAHYYDIQQQPDYSKETQAQNWDRNVRFYQQPVPSGAWVDPFWETWQFAQKGWITQASAGGYVRMNMHMVNDDGAGPFRCKIDMTAKADRGGNEADWDGWLEVNQTAVLQEDPSVVATRGRGVVAIHQPADYIMYANLPKNLDCKGSTLDGKITDLCMIRCENPASNGPFGGCIFFQQYRPPKKESYKPKPQLQKPKPTRPKMPKGYKDDTEPVQASSLPDDYQYKKRAIEEDTPKLRFKRD
ncbi:hypothetical protein ABW20_dc0105828 [Dactylellina cionopaga]|nr:hypothetical protein ABW20_dc0105828 [Dactylellina cionopaga]